MTRRSVKPGSLFFFCTEIESYEFDLLVLVVTDSNQRFQAQNFELQEELRRDLCDGPMGRGVWVKISSLSTINFSISRFQWVQ